MKDRFTKEQVAEAIMKANGRITTAAKGLNVRRETIYSYMRRYPDLAEVQHSCYELDLDYAESKLRQMIKSGNITAIIFFLKTKGRSRGYSENDYNRNGDNKLQIEHSFITGDKEQKSEKTKRVLTETDFKF